MVQAMNPACMALGFVLTLSEATRPAICELNLLHECSAFASENALHFWLAMRVQRLRSCHPAARHHRASPSRIHYAALSQYLITLLQISDGWVLLCAWPEPLF